MLFSKKDALATVDLKGFSGIDTSTLSSSEIKIRNMLNFRILPDGSLVKRNGFRPLLTLDSEVRAMWTGFVGEDYLGYALIGASVYKFLISEDHSVSDYTKIGDVGTSEGRATIFYYMSDFYLIDGKSIYDIKESSVEPTVGYAPLLGKDWGSNYVGEINEELNVLNNHVRISYVVGDPATIYLATMYEVSFINDVYLNGTRLARSSYSYDSEYRTVNVKEMNPGDKVVVYLTLRFTPSFDQRVFTNTEAFSFGGVDSSRVFMWNENDSMLFSTSHVDSENLSSSEIGFAGSRSLYIPAKSEINVGDGRYSLRAVDRHYDRLMIFTEGDTWMSDGAEEAKGSLPVMYINSVHGCLSPDAKTKAGNRPITVVDGQILRWMGGTDQFDECNYQVISEKIKDKIPEEFYRSAIAFEDKKAKEVLFAYPQDPLGRVYVFGEENEQWYIYDGIFAERFFDIRGKVGFLRQGTIYVFDADMDHDLLSDNTELDILAELTTDAIDFGYPERKKRLGYVSLMTDSGDGCIEVSFSGDCGMSSELAFDVSESEFVEHYSRRVSSARFTKAEMSVRVSGRTKHRIYSMSVCAKP